VPGERTDLSLLVWKAVCAGSVPAMRLYFEMLNEEDGGATEPADPLAFVDELAARKGRPEAS
jgi:hypothetical protein